MAGAEPKACWSFHILLFSTIKPKFFCKLFSSLEYFFAIDKVKSSTTSPAKSLLLKNRHGYTLLLALLAASLGMSAGFRALEQGRSISTLQSSITQTSLCAIFVVALRSREGREVTKHNHVGLAASEAAATIVQANYD